MKCQPSDIYFVTEGDRGSAYWRGVDDATDVFLCSVQLVAYNSESQVRDRFAELVAAVAAHRRREFVAGSAAPASRLAGLPCETCKEPEADDVRHHAAQIADASELVLYPGGLPIGCCKVHTAAVVGGRPNTSRSAAR